MSLAVNTQHTLILEIGTEEIPARFCPGAIIKLKENAEKIFAEYRLSFNSIKTYATPRRLSLIAEIDELQQAREIEVWGPPVNAAFDKNGNPTKAAEAFARTHNINVESLIKKEKGKGTYVVAVVKEEAKQTSELLPEILPKLILSLNFPKSMRWGTSNLRFVRPIHWIFAIYKNNKIIFEIDGIKSSNITKGHRFLSPAAFEIKDSKTYVNLLRNNFVILCPEERRRMILDGIKKLSSSINASLVEDEELLEHVTFLVEYPTPVLGSYPSNYLDLPKELLITVMKGHQKYFALQDEKGNLVNYFIAISDTRHENKDTIKAGAEKVIKARFEDARFYYEEDKKIPLFKRLDGLKKVIYHEKLGSLYDKTQRIASIADSITAMCCKQLENFEEFKKDVHTAALISKTDLISGVVGEFPELQGIMGSYYALNDEYKKEIATAIAEQYLPAHSGDRLPEGDIGAILSISDKIDNIVSFFMLGLTPSGTEDPFALRRQALGIISILIEKRYNLSLGELLEKTLQIFETTPGLSSLLANRKSQLFDALIQFFKQRVEPFFLSQDYPLDSISAVMDYLKYKPLYSIKEMLNAIKRLKEDHEYEPFLLAMKRVNNIAPKDEVPPVNTKLFLQDEEITLYKEVESISSQINLLLESNRYYDAAVVLMALKNPINLFFDKVLVMDKREDIKKNRLSLINSIKKLSQQIFDFSKLQ